MRFVLLIILLNFASFLVFPDNALAKQSMLPSSRQINVDQHGNLSVEVRQAPLIDIVNAIKRQTPIKFIVRTSGNAMITAQFTNLPLKQGLKRLFRDFNYAFIAHEKKPGHPWLSINTIILLDRGFVFEQANRIKTTKDPQANPNPIQHFKDSDPEMRRKAISTMGNADIEVYYSDITDLLISDPDEIVRAEAVRAIASHSNEQSVEILVDALNDESDAVKNVVINALASMGNDKAMKAFIMAVNNLAIIFK